VRPQTATAAVEPFDVALRSGATVQVRVAQPGDAERIEAFLSGLSAQSRWLRFFSGGVDLARAARETAAAGDGHQVLLAVTGGEGEVVGIGQLDREGPQRAEVAFAVADRMHGHGLGTVLLAHLAELARESGIEVLEARVLPENAAMRAVFRDSGFPFREHVEDGALVFETPAVLSHAVLARFSERERIATVNAVSRVLRPASLAIVGASHREDAVGSQVLANVLAAGYGGTLFVVNRRGGVLQGRATDKSLTAVGEPVDLVVVAVPADQVLSVAREAAVIGAGALVVLSAGFAEAGDEGRERQEALLAICREAGMRLVGPNCLGVLNTAPDVRLDATFAVGAPPRGSVALMSQSGALGIALLQSARDLGIGVSSFVSAGNKADLSGNDLLQFWEADEATRVILLYLESFGNPRNFVRIARRVGRSKPVIAVKSGRTSVGARAAGSHTGALIAASDVTVDALFRQAGVVRTDTLQEFLDVAALLERQPVPAGRRVAIVTNAGGPGILCADACIAAGLEVPEPPQEAQHALREALPPSASVANPIDTLASVDAATLARTVEDVARGGWADAVVAIFIEVAGRRRAVVEAALAQAVTRIADGPPVLAVMMSPRTAGDPASPLPTYAFPEQAARALARAVEYGRWCAAPPDPPPALADVRREEAAALLTAAAADGPRWLEPGEIEALCGCWGIPVVASRLVTDADAAAAAAQELGGAVAIKARVPGLLHKSDAGAVRLGLTGPGEVREAAAEMAARLDVEGFLVQPMIPSGVEMLVGIVQDPQFGPVVACGAGGVRAELERDVAVRLAPIGARDAREALRSLRTFPLLDGWRGAPAADVDALEDLVTRTAEMADAHPQIRELDFNPVIAGPDGCVVADARVRVERAPAARLWPAVGVTPPRSG
jgi:acyl-CoA synthetase (NDP forming)/GNAT superfamily N-acetyltransferase